MSNPLIIGIAGGTGSGKTTIARRIAEEIGPAVVVLDHDAYYRDQSNRTAEERAATNYDHPDALDNALFAEHIGALRARRAIEKPVYDFEAHLRTDQTVRVEPREVIIVEGILTLAVEKLRNLMDVKIFVDTDADIRLMRRVRRDMEQRGRTFASVREQYYKTVRPMHLAFVEPSKRYANLIVPEGGENRIAVDFVVGHLRHFLNKNEEALSQRLPVQKSERERERKSNA